MEQPNYSSIDSIQTKGPQQQVESNTLPPINGLQMQAYGHQQLYNGNGGSVPGSMPQTPITPHTPIPQTSSAPPDPGAYAHPGQNNAAPPRTLQPPPSYPSSQPSATLVHAPQHYGGSAIRQNDLLPRLQQPMSNMMGGVPQQSAYIGGREPEPTHVVGQQGRRGILPSVAGRPAPNGKVPIPQKNEEGKFPCPHCTKTYLHAKHLKRHMLRRKQAPIFQLRWLQVT
jgi:hypothetical protein